MATSNQITFTTPRRRTDEGSSLIVTARFRDRATAADVTPTNTYYRLDCLDTGAPILDWTSISPSTSVSITVTSGENAMNNSSSRLERKQITVAADYGLSTEYREHFVWETQRRI